MKKLIRRSLAGLVALCLLAGCAGKDDRDPQSGTGTEGAGESVIYRVAGLDYDDTVATVNGKAVTAQTYLFMLLNTIEGELAYGLDLEEEWTQEQKDAMVSDALDSCALFWILQDQAAGMGVELTQEDEDELRDELNQLEESMGGEEQFLRQLSAICMTREGYAAVNRTNYLYASLGEYMEREGLLAATDQEIADYIEENGVYAAKHILLMTQKVSEDGEEYVELSDDQKERVRERIQGLYDQIMAAEDREAEFDRLMDEYSEDTRNPDGTLYKPDGYGSVYPGYMVPEFEEGAMALEEGEISAPVQSSYGYHIIMRIPVDVEEVRYDVEGPYKFNGMLNQWLDEAVVETTPDVDGLDPQAFYRALDEIRTEMAVEDSQNAPESSANP